MDEENMPVMYKQHQLRLRRNYAKKLIKADAYDVLVIRWFVVRKFCFSSNSRQRSRIWENNADKAQIEISTRKFVSKL